MKRGNKSGQFYMISAIVLSAVLISILSIANYIGGSSNPRIYDIGDELKIESRSFIDYGMYNSLSDEEFHNLFLEFAGDYVSHLKSSVDIYLMFGTTAELTIAGYQDTAKEVVFEGTSSTEITSVKGDFSGSVNPGGSSVVLHIGDSEHSFELTSTKNIYFILYEELNSNEYVVKW